MASARNKTIRLGAEETARYAARALTPHEPLSPEACRDRLLWGDTFELCRYLPKASVDLLIADPPYNLTKCYNGHTFSQKSFAEYEAYTRRWLEAVRPLLKKDASVYVFCDWQTGMILAPVLADFFQIRNRITWQREKGRGASSNWKNGMEDIWYGTLSSTPTFHLDAVRQRRRVLAPYKENGAPKDWKEENGGKFRDTCPSNFWDDITIPYWSMAENTPHPTQKPEKLLAKLILASSNEGDLVFDPFVGSGSTAVTAKKLGRHYLGIEREGEYIALGEKRLERADTDTSIQGFENGIFYHRNYHPL